MQKLKLEWSLKVNEEVIKQFEASFIMVVNYLTWLANVVLMPKKDGRIRVCVDYRDLNKASPKDEFPLPNIHILVENTAGHEIYPFKDGFSGYNQILLDEEDMKKTTFITP